MNATRCKMKLVSISGGHYNDSKGRSVTLVPVTSGSEENKKFFDATPSGKLELTISSTAAESLGLDAGKISSEFYVDITPAA